jgi:hypothetical protein
MPGFPLTELGLCRFVAFLVREGLTYSSIRQYLAALRHHQLLNFGIDPVFSSFHFLHYVLRGTHQLLPSSVHPLRLPVTPEVLFNLHNSWKERDSYDARCLWAACCLGFFGFLRAGEFTCSSEAAYHSGMLSLSDVSIDNKDNPSIIYINLRSSKTDAFGEGVTIHLGRTSDILCPVSALLAYLAIRPPSPGPLFVLSSGKPLSHGVLVDSVRQALSPVMRDVTLFNGHSFRIGAATTAALAGIPDSTIMKLGRWKSSAFLRYLRPPVESMAALSRRLLRSP